MPESTPVPLEITGGPVQLAKPLTLVERFAGRYHVEPTKLLATLKATAFRQSADKETGQFPEVTNEQMMALLVVADQYRLNPFTREIYAFSDPKRGGIVPIVGLDGWARIINEQGAFNGMEFAVVFEEKTDKPFSVTCTMHRKDREHPTVVTEYYRECRRSTGPWDSHPARMLRHKAMIQCARIAFGFVGIYDEDEGARIVEGEFIRSSPAGVDELNAELVKPAEGATDKAPPAAQEAVSGVPAGERGAEEQGMTLAELLAQIKRAKTDDDYALALDLAARGIWSEPQQAELDVELRAAHKRIAK